MIENWEPKKDATSSTEAFEISRERSVELLSWIEDKINNKNSTMKDVVEMIIEGDNPINEKLFALFCCGIAIGQRFQRQEIMAEVLKRVTKL